MVNFREQRLDRIFGVLSDATRRAILSRLASTGGVSVSELAEPFDIKLPAVLKHLDILDEAGLIRRSKSGRTVTVELAAGSLETAVHWLQDHERFWTASLDRLVRYAEVKQRESKRR